MTLYIFSLFTLLTSDVTHSWSSRLRHNLVSIHSKLVAGYYPQIIPTNSCLQFALICQRYLFLTTGTPLFFMVKAHLKSLWSVSPKGVTPWSWLLQTMESHWLCLYADVSLLVFDSQTNKYEPIMELFIRHRWKANQTRGSKEGRAAKPCCFYCASWLELQRPFTVRFRILTCGLMK